MYPPTHSVPAHQIKTVTRCVKKLKKDWLIKAGARLDIKNNEGFTALEIAQNRGDEETVRLIEELSQKRR